MKIALLSDVLWDEDQKRPTRESPSFEGKQQTVSATERLSQGDCWDHTIPYDSYCLHVSQKRVWSACYYKRTRIGAYTIDARRGSLWRQARRPEVIGSHPRTLLP